ncbi:hypothetical protein CI105_08990 [Candidatus Izimaplasma bacterium ZiA1]|uniref:aminoglycoside phosphotransferase family protein n=1 Tax=Candidatus Izimoplasma sp. ZiA1 TaxID=2024899 RepID=UPI000BAA82B4|nr:hypothetical protein CI105_08990 [Candidatus Izimaplasma bacterium ZiA1]
MKLDKVIGKGNTAVVYDIGDEKVLKLFNEGYPLSSIKYELKNSLLFCDFDLISPKVYDILDIKTQHGIVYEKLTGESLLDIVLSNYDLQNCAKTMASLHKKILVNVTPEIVDYKDFLKKNIVKANKDNPKKLDELLNKLKLLDEQENICHGDFHPGNIIITNEGPAIIDFMNICKGPKLYDIARTVYLVEYTPVPKETPNRDEIVTFKHNLASVYLEEMKVKRSDIKDYIEIINEARKGECPFEFETKEV